MIESQNEAPLVTALRRHGRGERLSFHTPGHKGRPDWNLACDPAWDVTELPGLDDLHAPSGPIAEAQELCARLYGADHSFFLVNGSTVGMQALCLAALNPGDEVILPRHVHRSAVAGLVLSGAVPRWIPSRWEESLHVPYGPAPEDLERLIRECPQARAVFLVNPNYQGFCPESGELIAQARAAGMLVLADEAHGSHLGFSDKLPAQALRLGADASVMSFHKTLGSMTGSAVLHLSGPRIDPRRVQSALRLLQTSSPSYILLVSLDLARRRAARHGARLAGRLIGALEEFREKIAAVPGMACPGSSPARCAGLASCDPFKILLVPEADSGHSLAAALRRRGVGVEMSAPAYALAVVGLGDTPASLRRLAGAVEAAARELKSAGRPRQALGPSPLGPGDALPEARLTPRDAFQAPRVWVPLREAAGRTAADCVTVSPPGSVVISPGEVIAPETAECLEAALGEGLSVQGVESDRIGDRIGGSAWLPVVAE